MTVKDLWKTEQVKNCERKIPLSRLASKRAVIDCGHVIRQYLYQLDENDRINFLHRTKAHIEKLRAHNIQVVFCFDGVSPPWKESERMRRKGEKLKKIAKLDELKQSVQEQLVKLEGIKSKRKRDEQDSDDSIKRTKVDETLLVHVELNVALDGSIKIFITPVISESESLNQEQLVEMDLEDLEDDQDIEMQNEIDEAQAKLQKNQSFVSIDPTPNDFELLKKLLDVMLVPWVQSRYETDFTAVALYKQGLVDLIFCADGDLLVGGMDVVRVDSLFNLDKPDGCSLYRYKDVLESFGFTAEQFREWSYIVGCDYTKGINGYGTVKALEEMRKHSSLDNVVTHLLKKNQDKIAIETKKKCKKPETDAKRHETIKRLRIANKQTVEFQQLYHETWPKCIDHDIHTVVWQDLYEEYDEQAVITFIKEQVEIFRNSRVASL